MEDLGLRHSGFLSAEETCGVAVDATPSRDVF